jgi:hypothetical protein
MRYIVLAWKHEGCTYKFAHDFGQEYTTQDIVDWMRYQLDEQYPHFAFMEIDAAKYDYYTRRKLTLDSFG